MSEFEFIEGLVIGPDDRLVLSLPPSMNDHIDGILFALESRLKKLGLMDRTLVLAGDVEIGKVTP